MANKTTAIHRCIEGQQTIKTGYMPSKYDTMSSGVVGSDYKNSVSDKYYKDKIAKNIDASHPFTSVKYYDIKASEMSIYSKKMFGTQVQEAYGRSLLLPDNVNVVLPDLALIADVAAGNLRKSIQKDFENFQALVPLGELKETRNTLKTVASKSLTLVNDLLLMKKHMKNPRYWSSIANQASDRWLEFSFGIKPLISDVNSLLKAIDSTLNPPQPKLKSYVGYEECQKPTKGIEATMYNSGHVGVIHASLCASSIKIYFNAGVLPRVSYTNDYSVGDNFGLNFGSMVPAAWELTPYSWLLDYFTTTGEFLSEEFTSRPYKCIYITKTIVREDVYTSSIALGTIPSGVSVNGFYPKTGGFKKVTIVRTVEQVVPIPLIRFKTADEIGRNAVNRLLNLSSLLVQRNTRT